MCVLVIVDLYVSFVKCIVITTGVGGVKPELNTVSPNVIQYKMVCASGVSEQGNYRILHW